MLQWSRKIYHYLFFFDNLHLQIIQNISTVPHGVKSNICEQRTVTECILILLDPSTALRRGGGQLLAIFIDLVCTNILHVLAMLGFLLSQKRHADFCFKPSGLFFFFDDLHLQIIMTMTELYGYDRMTMV